ncbi:MAG: oligosaccharide flippase family protein [Sneathiellaceae bacterium]
MASGSAEPGGSGPGPAGDGGALLERIGRRSIGILGLTIVNAAVQFGLTIALGRMLAPAGYGDLIAGMAALGAGVNIAMLGSERSITRFLPEYLRRGDLRLAVGYLKFFLPLVLGLALAAALIAEALHDTGVVRMVLRDREALSHPYIVAIWLIPLLAMARLSARLLRGFRLYLFAVAPLQIGAPLFLLLTALAAHALGVRLTEPQVFILLGIGYLLALLTHLAVVPGFFRRSLREPGSYAIREWVALSLPMMVTAVLAGAMFQVDILMVEILSPSETEAGHFAAAVRLCRPLGLPLAAMLILLPPLLGHIAGAADEAATRRRLFRWGCAVLLPANGLLLAGMALFPTEILSLLGPDYADAAPALVTVAALEFLLGCCGLGLPLLQYANAQRLVLWLSLTALLLNIAGNAVLIPEMGGLGAAVASLVSYGGLALATTAIAILRYGLLRKPGAGPALLR